MPDNREVFLYHDGLVNLAGSLKGDETLFVGIRPNGFHAGNILTMLAYPFLLFEEVEKRTRPRFNYFVSINDWEPENIIIIYKGGSNVYEFRVKGTSFQYAKDESGCCDSMTAHWEGRIKDKMSVLKKYFPGISLTFRKNSELRDYQVFAESLERTLSDKKGILGNIERTSGIKIDDEKVTLASAICKSCYTGDTVTKLNERLEVRCNSCNSAQAGQTRDFDFWWYHLPMLIPRLVISGADVMIRGGDHLRYEGDKVLMNLLHYFYPEHEMPKRLFAQMMLASDERKMSKSYRNTVGSKIESLVKVARNNNKPTIHIKEVDQNGK